MGLNLGRELSDQRVNYYCDIGCIEKLALSQ